MQRKDVVILGGGLSGLYIAYSLLKRRRGINDFKVTIIEKEEEIGGLLRSTCVDGNWCDNGTFFFRKAEGSLVESFPNLFSEVENDKHVVWKDGDYRRFPIDVRKTLSHFGLIDYLFLPFIILINKLRRTLINESKNLECWLKIRLSKKIYKETGLKSYVEKIQGLPADKIDVYFGNNRLRIIDEYTKLKQILKLLYKKIIKTRKRVNYYPKQKGVGSIVSYLENQIINLGGDIMYQVFPTEIKNNNLDNKYKIALSNGEIITADYIFSTIPCTSLASLLFPGNKDINNAIDNLEYRDLAIVFIIVKGEKVLEDVTVIYSFDESNPWKRLVSPTSILKNSSNLGKTSFVIETVMIKRKYFDKNNLINEILHNLSNDLSLFNKNDVEKIEFKIINDAYPVFKIGFEEQLKILKDKINCPTLKICGRTGNFIQVSTKSVILDAKNHSEQFIKHFYQ